MKKFATLFIFMGMVLISIAQGSLQDGWVQLNNGDTLYGKILEKDWNLSPSHIDFYHPDPTKYGIEDLQSFGITGGDIYKRFVVQRHLLPYNENNDFPEDESQVDSIKNWLKMILQAKVSLAVLYQRERAYFYAIDFSGIAIELVASKGIKDYNREQYRNDPRFGQSILVNQPAFRGQFQDLFPEFPDKFDPNSVEYTEQSLAATFRKLNHLEPTRTKKSFFLGISGGASLFTSSLEGMTGTLLNGASFQNSTTPFVRISFNFQMGKRRSPRITFVPEIGMSMFKTTGSKTNYGGQYSFEINKTFLEAAIMTKLWLNPAARHKLYLAGGINAYFGIAGKNEYEAKSISDNISYYPDEPKQHSSFLAPSLTTGYEISKFNIFVNYQPLGNLTTYAYQSWTVNRYSAGISWYLKK